MKFFHLSNCAFFWLFLILPLISFADSYYTKTHLDLFYAYKDHDPEKAKALLLELLALDPDSLTLNEELSYLYLREGKLAEALPYLEKAHSLNPTDGKLVLQIGYTLDLLKRKDEAIQRFQEALGYSDPAIQEKAKTALINLQGAQVSKATVETPSLPDTKEKQIKLQVLLADQPDSFDLNMEMGYLLYNKKEYEKALPYFKKAHSIRNEDQKVSLQIAYTLDNLNRFKEAEKYFQLAMQGIDYKVKKQARDALIVSKEKEASHLAAKKESETPLAKFYRLKEKQPEEAYCILLQLIRDEPKNLTALKEMAQVQLARKCKWSALYYFKRSLQLDFCNFDLAMQAAVVENELGYHKDAFHLLTSYLHFACKKKERIQLSDTRRNVFRDYAKITCPPYFIEMNYNPIWFGRFLDLVDLMILRAGFRYGKNDRYEFYLKNFSNQDTRSNIQNGLPQILADNVIIISAGARWKPFAKNFPYMAFYVEGGYAYDLLYRNRDRWRPDLRYGVFLSRDCDPILLTPPCLTLRKDHFREIYFDTGYYSRYRNVIGYARWREGFKVLEWRESHLRLYGRLFLAGDSRGEFFNNFVETGPGVALYPIDLLSLALRYEWIRGDYIKRNSPTPNPYGNRYYDNRLTLEFFHFY